MAVAQQMRMNGFRILSTHGTAQYLIDRGIPVERVHKVKEGSPHIVDMILDRKVDLVMNTTSSTQSHKDSFSIRRSALEKGIPYFTTLQGAWAAAQAIAAFKHDRVEPVAVQSL